MPTRLLRCAQRGGALRPSRPRRSRLEERVASVFVLLYQQLRRYLCVGTSQPGSGGWKPLALEVAVAAAAAAEAGALVVVATPARLSLLACACSAEASPDALLRRY